MILSTIPLDLAIPPSVSIVECHDFRNNGNVQPPMPPSPVVRIVFKKGFEHLLLLKNLETGVFTLSEVIPNPPLEWRPLSRNEGLSEKEAKSAFLEWANR